MVLHAVQRGSSLNSRVVRGPGLRGENKGAGTGSVLGKRLLLLSNCQAGGM